ncbi:uncharacterized protein LAJ45_01561 [Morchella importuna]|uniref:uncharacterized protein n=1 Tax=Morchella importuna TaxID=1174673 RepID=UPI001E8ED28D|nr:uncharacterized protein LAJ45_01561 [Morchella importuna]KAH8153794.1 hypothetical protein LAJ45_01561 [Morchella importuna]
MIIITDIGLQSVCLQKIMDGSGSWGLLVHQPHSFYLVPRFLLLTDCEVVINTTYFCNLRHQARARGSS